MQVGANVTRQFTPEFAAGLSLRYDYQDWKWDDPAAFGGAAPWSKLNAPVIGLNLSYAIAPDWRLGFNPAVEWSGESGANAGDSLSYGAVLSATRIFSPDLVLGVGAGVFRQIDETKVFPFLVVNWKITDRLRLGNPLQAGPAGGAGLELAYALSDRWEAGGRWLLPLVSLSAEGRRRGSRRHRRKPVHPAVRADLVRFQHRDPRRPLRRRVRQRQAQGHARRRQRHLQRRIQDRACDRPHAVAPVLIRLPAPTAPRALTHGRRERRSILAHTAGRRALDK